MIEPGDAVIGISASGDSLNIINALTMAQETHATTIALLGAHGGRIKHMVDAYVLAPGQNIEQEEDAHLMMPTPSHAICVKWCVAMRSS